MSILPLLVAVGAGAWFTAAPTGRALLHAAAAQEPDTDGDTMPDAWETFFGLDPNDAGDATGDPDGDGVTNVQEYAGRRHPNGLHARYFAEGSTGYFDTSVGVLNLSETATAHVAIALLNETGGVVSHQLTLAPRQRQTVSINTVLGVSAAVSIVVESDVPMAADRWMTWGSSGIGASLDSGAPAPATTWYFAEGATGAFLLYYLFENPGMAPATVTIRYLVEGGAPVERMHTLPPQSRTTIPVNAVLAAASVGSVITSTAPIFAERAMYVNAGGALGGGSASAGSSQLSTNWYFGEGSTGPFFECFLSLLNPGTTAATATVTYHMSDGSTASKAYTVPASGRRTVYFNGEAAADPALASLATGPVWFTVSSTQPILGERAMWWWSWPWYEGHAAPGSTTTDVSWAVPEGRHGGPALDETYVLIGNTTATPGQVRLTLIPDTGAPSTRDLPIAAGQRLTINAGSLFGLTAGRFSVVVDSLGSPAVPIAVDYARYRSVNGVPFSGGGAAPAVPVPPSDPAPSVTTTTPAADATGVAVGANLTVTFSEPVTAGAGAFVLECPTGTPVTLTNLTASPATTFTLDPTADLPANTSCTLRIVASQIADADAADPPDVMAANVTVPFTTGCPTITITPSVTPVPGGVLAAPYGPVTFSQAGSPGPITWTTTGNLPPGVALSSTGVLAGTPTQAGTFSFTVVATGPGACSGSLPVTITITSAPNQSPSFAAGPGQAVLEDAGAQTVPNWATAISPGASPEEAGQLVTFIVTGNTNPALFSTAPAVSPTGTLTYTPAPNANGAATITLVLQDNGGTTLGGDDTSAPQSFTITVVAVNDAPGFTVGPNQTVPEDAGPQTVPGWATAVSAGPTDEAGQTLTFTVTANTNPTLFSAAPAISPSGELTFTSAPNAAGTATITVTLQDNGGTANGGVDTALPQTFTITITAVNDAPTAVADVDTTDEDAVLTVAAPGVLANDVDPDPGDALIVTAVNGLAVNVGTPITLLSGALLTANADGSGVYDPTGVAAFRALGPGQSATDSFTYTIQDSGGLASTATVTITITGVNDIPVVDLDADDDGGTPPTTGDDFAITFTEGSPPQFIQDEVDATVTDVDSANLSSITVTITNVLDALQEKLDVDLVTGGFTANFTKTLDESTPGVAVLTIAATTPQPIASFNTLLRRVTYQNLDTAPDTTTPRIITFAVSDGIASSDDATTTVTVVAADSPPTAVADSYTVAEGATLPVAASGVLGNDSDPDSTGATLTATLVTGPANASSFTLNADGSFSYAHNGSETTTDSFTYTATSSAGGTSTAATVTITITAVNDAPVITAGGVLNFVEGNVATVIDGTVAVTDPDSANLTGATVQILPPNYVNGQDILAMPVVPGITAVFNALSGTLTLSGPATVATYQAALRSVTYFNNSATPSVAPRTVAWTVTDGALASNTALSTITVTAVNSAPVGGADAWTTFGNTELVVDQAGPATPFVADATASTSGVLDNDTDVEGDPRIVGGIVGCADTTAPFACSTTGGGSVTMESNGRFTYRPQAGDTGTDTFQYILSDVPSAGVPATVNVPVTLTLQERIWYVDGDATGGPGTGTSDDPFSALPATAGDANDYIFVHDSTVTGGITLQNGQKLYGEGFGLVINQSLNGNPAPVTLVAAGNAPTITAATGNTVTVLANTASGNLANLEIRGLSLAATAATSNAVDITTANAANVAVTISDVTVTGATSEGIDINQASTGTATVSMTDVTVTSTGTGIDLNESAGTMTVTSFNGITVTGDTGGSGIVVTNATFDASAGAPYNQVAGGATAVGDAGNPVGGSGVVLTNISGDLAFTDLDIFTSNGAALQITGTGAVNTAAGTGTLVSVASGVGTFQSTGGAVLDVTNATVNLPLDSASVTSSPTTGISLVNVASGTTPASVSATSGSIASTTGISVNVNGGTVSLNYGGNITQTSNTAMVSVADHTTGTITFSGTLNATNGSGLQFDNADSTTSYNFTGTTTLNGGNAAIDIINTSDGTFTFGTGTTITNPTGPAFLLAGANANVTYSGSISDDTLSAVIIDNHDSGTVTFQTGSITSTGTGTGITVSNSNGGVINFNSPTISLTTGANQAVTIAGTNSGATINFAPAGGNGLDISTTTGTGFSALSGTVSVTGTGNTINSTGAMAIELTGVIVGAGGVNFASTTSGGGARNVKLTSVTGAAVALGGGSLTGSTGAAFLIGDGAGGASTGGTSAITYSGTISATGAARTVDIQDRPAGAGNITLSGALSHSGNGNGIFLDDNAAGTIAFAGAGSTLNGGTSTAVSLTDNAGATINFTGGGLNIDATGAAGSGFVATGGGTVSVTGTGNTIDTTSSAALNVANTTIGASGLTFQSISSNGAQRGIILNTTGAGAFTVTGTGVTDGSGGTIQASTGRGAEFISASSISLSNMNFSGNGTAQTVPGSDATCGSNLRTGNNLACVSNIHLQSITGVTLTNLNVTNGGQMGINGNSVAGFTLANSTVTGNGNESFENGITFQNLTGTVTITNTIVKDNEARQIHVANNSNSSVTLNISGTRTNNAFPTQDTSTTEIGNTAAGGVNTQQGILLETFGAVTANAAINVTGVVFNNNSPQNAVDLQPLASVGTLGGATSNSSFDSNAAGLIISAQNGSGGTYDITNSEFNRSALQSILYAAAEPTSGTLQGTISGNTIGTAGSSGSACFPTTGSNCTGIDVNFIGGSGAIRLRIQNNTIQQFDGNGIRFVGNSVNGAALHANVLNNTIQNPLGLNANGIDTNVGTTANANVVGCFTLNGNAVTGTYENPGPGELGIHTRVRFLSEHRLPGMTGTGSANALAFLTAQNPGTAGSKIFVEGSGVPGYQSGAACTTP